MQSTSAKIILSTDSKVTAQVSITRDDSGNQTWFKWGGTLALPFDSGTWEYQGGDDPNMLFLNDSRDKYALLFSDVPEDFFKAFCAKTFAGWGHVNADKARTIQWVIWTGCV
jgi:hypothetical protein